jgi:16S rRNA (adenine1518-N6/adenine1519-N6)-dimethyltransferase
LGQKLGQHFLASASILERIASAACPEGEDLVIEIGPGRGALTDHLLRRSQRVIAIELDPHLAAHLRRQYAGEPRLEVVEADVLATDLRQWGPAAIAGNLPYYITSPIIDRVLQVDFTRAVFLVQKEVAQRIAAVPGTRDYGYLSVQTACRSRARVLFTVKPGAFQPPPKVHSAVVLLEPYPAPVPDCRDFLEFVSRCFRQKRKTLRNNLVPFYGKDLVEAQPEAGSRAEQLTLQQFASLYLRVFSEPQP